MSMIVDQQSIKQKRERKIDRYIDREREREREREIRAKSMITKRRKLSEPKRTSFCISAKRRAEREASILRTQIANLLIEERVERARDLKVALHAKENEILQMIMNM